MFRRLALIAGSVVALLLIGWWQLPLAPEPIQPPPQAETRARARSQAEPGKMLEPKPEAASTATASSAAKTPRVFGLNGPVKMEEVPAGRLRNELLALQPGARARALKKLGDQRVPMHDVASLRVDDRGYFYYECAPLSTRLAAELSALSAAPTPVVTGEPVVNRASVPIASPPVRHSKPGATKVIFLDFNGHTITGTSWNNSRGTVGEAGYRPAVATYVAKPFDTDGDTTTFSDAEQTAIVRVWERVAEDFKPFDVDVTTESPASFNPTTGRVLITDSVDANGVDLPSPDSAGIAYKDVFGDPDYVTSYSPAFVYADNNYDLEHYIAETASHEMGHNLSLSHDGAGDEEYYGGHGYGQTSWNAIMGGAFTEHVTQWSKGEYQNASNTEDDLAILSGHLGYATDDHADTNGSATALTVNGQNFSGQGVIGQTGEADRFSFTATAGTISFTVTPHRSPANTHGGNLDVALALYDSANQVVNTASPSGATAATLVAPVTAGAYYLRVIASGDGSSLTNGYSNYGSLGQYTIISTFTPPTLPNITSNPANQSVYTGQTAQFQAYAGGSPTPAYRWQRLPAGSSAWADLAEGSGYAGTGTANLSVTTIQAMSGDQFRCVASNVAGSATSNTATLAVLPATPPSIYSNPYGTSVIDGTGAYFNCYASGTDPLTFRWQRLPAGSATWVDLTNVGGYAGTGTSYLSVSPVTLAMSGDQFRCVVSNGGGSATSNAATLTVTPVVPPSVSNLPSTLTVNYGESLYLYPSINGTYPYTIQWYKDGVAISGAGSQYFSKYNCTQADSGSYTVTVSNSAGSVTSSAAVVTVNPVMAPSITQQPASVEVAKGYSASFSVSVAGSPQLIFQWYKNGQAIAYANSSSYGLQSATEADNGYYTVRITNDGGSVTSAAAELVVLPAVLPKITSWNSRQQIYADYYPSLSLNASVSGTSPMAYQWYKDDVPIAGATSSSYYSYSVTAASAGVYTLRVTNEAGTVLSPECFVTWVNSTAGTPWLDSVRLGDIVYFLAVSPGRIMRYNLVQESWMPIVYLPESKVPTAFLPTAEGVFIAYNYDLFRRSLDLSAGSETKVGTSSNPIRMLFGYGELVYFENGSNAVTYNRTTLNAGLTFSLPYPWLGGGGGFGRSARPVFMNATATGFTTRPNHSPNDIIKFPMANDGTIPSCSDSPYHGDFSIGNRQYLSPDDQYLIDNTGVVYKTSDLTYAASLGLALDDLAFLSDGTPVALRGQTLTAHGGSGYAETGQHQLTSACYSIFGKGDAVYCFSAPASSTSNPGVAKVPSSALVPATVAVPGNPANKLISVEDAFIDANGVIHLMSYSEKGIVRWDARISRNFLTTLPLRGRPLYASYAPAIDRLAMLYGDGSLTDLFPDSDTSEQRFGYVPVQNTPFSLVALDELTQLNLRAAGTSADLKIVLGPLGELKYRADNVYNSTGQLWQSSNRRLYSYPSYSYNNSVGYTTLSLTGSPVSAEISVNNIVPPLRLSPDGLMVLASNKRVLNADLQQVGVLENSTTDGVWLPQNLFTIRPRPSGTELQKWARITYEKTGSLLLPGIPLRIFQVDDKTLAVVSLVKGYLAFCLVSTDLSVIQYSVNATTVSGAPVISAHPANQTVSAGSSVTFTAESGGIPAPTYQWQRNGVNINGATGSAYTIPVAAVTHGGTYRVVVANSAGVTVSHNATLTVEGSVVADFNGDGKQDLLWQNTATGERSIWHMNGTTVTGGGSLGVIPVDWQVAATADFNADGATDLLWQNNLSGERVIWLMNGVGVSASVSLGVLTVDWQLVAAADFTGDSSPDIVWQHAVTGDRVVWTMSGTTVTGGAFLGNLATEWSITCAGDFNADGKSDLVLQNIATGERAVWLMDGLTLSSSVSLGLTSLDWSIAGSGDLNRDGKDDLLLQHALTGERIVWLMNGTTVSSQQTITTLSTDWALFIPPLIRRGYADFDSNGKTDLVWQNTVTGERSLWLMNGTTLSSTVSLGTIPLEWKIAGSGDLNGDGKTDLVWQNTASGEGTLWLMEGTLVGATASLGTQPLEWKIACTGDFNRDGRADLVWQNTTTGERQIWLMNGGTVSSVVSLGVVALDWQIAASGDFDADGRSDLVWQNTISGERLVWFMSGTVVRASVSLAVVPLDWKIAGTGDFNGDTKTDIIWQNTDSGDRIIWVMVGTLVGGGISIGPVSLDWSIRN